MADEQVAGVAGAVAAPVGESLKSEAIKQTEKETAAAAEAPIEFGTAASEPAQPSLAQRVAEMTHAELAGFAHSLHERLVAIEAWVKAHL